MTSVIDGISEDDLITILEIARICLTEKMSWLSNEMDLPIKELWPIRDDLEKRLNKVYGEEGS